MSPILEPNYYGLWAGKQTAKGTKNAAPSKRFIQVGGDFGLARDDQTEAASDLTKYGYEADAINSILGQGEPVVQASPTELAYLLWLFHGGEVVTPVTGPPTAQKHTFTPSTGRPHWATFARRVGNSIPMRHSMNDSLVTRVQLEGSTANKFVRATGRVLSLDPFEVIASDPVTAMPTDKSFLYTDGSGLFTIDATPFPGATQFTFVADEDLSPVFGDDVVPFEVVQGNPSATIAATILFDAAALAEWNTLIYGSATPVAGTKPRKTLPALGSYSAYLKQRDAAGALNGREFKLTCPSVKWAIPDAPAPAAGGGSTEVALAGSLRPSGVPLYTIDVNTANGDVAFTV